MMVRLRELGQWIADWRTGVTLLAACLVGLLVAVVVTSGVTAHDAIDARNKTADAAGRRIDELMGQIAKLNARAEENGRLIGEERAQREALQEQVRQLGAKPVIVTLTTSPTTSAPRSTPPTPTTTPPSPTTPTSQPPRRCLVVICTTG